MKNKLHSSYFRQFFFMFMALLCIISTSCSSVSGPKKIPVLGASIESMQFMSVTEYEAYNKQFHGLVVSGKSDDLAKAERLRNLVVSELLAEVDLVYDEYEEALSEELTFFNIGTDWSKLGLSAAIAIVGTEETKTILGTVLTALQGAALSVKENVYREQTKEAIMAQMEANRTEVRIRIVRKMTTASPSFYTLSDGRSDVIEYLKVGTVRKALQKISMKAGKDAIEAQKSLTDMPMLPKVSPEDTKLSRKVILKYYEWVDERNPDGLQLAVSALTAYYGKYEQPKSREQVFEDLRKVMKEAASDPAKFQKLVDAMGLQ